jgi:uncharacterized iron-regulated membrane protein
MWGFLTGFCAGWTIASLIVGLVLGAMIRKAARDLDEDGDLLSRPRDDTAAVWAGVALAADEPRLRHSHGARHR